MQFLKECKKFSKELWDNQDLREEIVRSNQFGPIVLEIIKTIQKYKEGNPSRERKAVTSLTSILYESVSEIKGINNYVIKESDIELIVTYLDGEEYTNEEHEISNSPIIEKFSNCLFSKILKNNDPIMKQNFFNIVQNKIKNNESIQEYNEEQVEPYKNSVYLIKYMQWLKKNHEFLVEEEYTTENFIENDAVKMLKQKDWNLSDDESEKMLNPKTRFNFRDDFLESPKKKLVVGASFGIGKTSFAKHWTTILVNNRLTQNTDGYVPVFVYLKNGFGSVYVDENLETVMENLMKNEQIKILLILDGLDEFKKTDKIPNPIEYTEHYLEHGNVKRLITTRLIANPPFTSLGIKDGDKVSFYVRLLPFTEEKVNEFFKKTKPSMDYRKADLLGLSSNEIRKPLFCWILTKIDPNFHVISKSLSDYNVKKTALYTEFLKSLHLARYTEDNNGYIQKTERRILQTIAALKNIYSPLNVKTIVDELLIFDPESEDNSDYKFSSDILNSYFYIDDSVNPPKFEFNHKSFAEYLLAEYYLRCVMSGNNCLLNVGIPSEETILFLQMFKIPVYCNHLFFLGMINHGWKIKIDQKKYQQFKISFISADN